MRTARLVWLLAAAAACARPASAAQTSRDGHFSVALPPEYIWVLPQYPEATHSHIVAAWELGGAEPRRVEVAVQSLRYMTPQEREDGAAASCERWTQLDELSSPCQTAALSSGVSLHYAIRSARRGQDQLIGFFDLGHGLVYCLLARVPSGDGRAAAVDGLLRAFSTLARADAFEPPAAPKCEKDYAPVYENWPRAGDWKCRLTAPEENKRILAPTGEPFNPVTRVKRCPEGLSLAIIDEPVAGDYGCVDFAQTTQRLVERFNHTQVFKCDKSELPVFLKRDGRKREFVCRRRPSDAPKLDDEKPRG